MSQQKRLGYLLALNIAMTAGLIAVGMTSHSLGVLAAGGDFIADSFAIFLGLIAVHLRDNHGHQKAPTYVALINGTLLFIITVIIMVQAAHRLATSTPEIHGLPVLLVSAISTLVMIAGVLILGKGADNEDLHMRSVLLDTISDGLAAATVAVVGGIIYFSKNFSWLDSVAALLIGAVIGYGAVKLLKDVYKSLRSGTALVVGDD